MSWIFGSWRQLIWGLAPTCEWVPPSAWRGHHYHTEHAKMTQGCQYFCLNKECDLYERLSEFYSMTQTWRRVLGGPDYIRQVCTMGCILVALSKDPQYISKDCCRNAGTGWNSGAEEGMRSCHGNLPAFWVQVCLWGSSKKDRWFWTKIIYLFMFYLRLFPILEGDRICTSCPIWICRSMRQQELSMTFRQDMAEEMKFVLGFSCYSL